MTSDWEQQIKAQIRQRYAGLSGSAEDGATKAIEHGYPADLISEIPGDLIAGYSGCGYLFEDLDFKGNETVVDLGAGAGLDSYIAASQLTDGMVISVDMTIEMLVNSRQSLINLLQKNEMGTGIVVKKVAKSASISRQSLINLCADIEALPLKNACADLVMANASFNLTISKEKAFAEAYRILKPGGRLVARDLVKDGELPAEVLSDPLSYNTSLGGALAEDALITEISKAGFKDVTLSDHREFSYVQSVKIIATAS